MKSPCSRSSWGSRAGPDGARGGDGRAPPTVAAAANLNFALTEIADQFARDTGTRVELVFGASGTLTRQIQDGAPFELFLSADEDFPNRLSAAGLTRDAGVVYAIGRLVVFAPTGSPLTVDERLDGLARLLEAGGVTRFAIANPDVAPYGKAAEAVLRKRGLWDAIDRSSSWGTPSRRPRSSPPPETPSAGSWRTPSSWDLAWQPRHVRRHPRDGSPATAPADGAAQERQPTAAGFYAYLQSDAARAIFQKHGYGVPQ